MKRTSLRVELDKLLFVPLTEFEIRDAPGVTSLEMMPCDDEENPGQWRAEISCPGLWAEGFGNTEDAAYEAAYAARDLKIEAQVAKKLDALHDALLETVKSELMPRTLKRG